ncbi:hypothetical protein Cfla_2975 [Cellulomonas flavigena DSM 20109]|uniref:Uncharacterized protein n=1 Tax=Cellulomonas flavigena (strain ATCC 482 / DSM 20109 / BCRC 11376 / JCM 18109 / NBRC 3775 / NCIMB 8073 / NRS 134) TaxID=446466 RepID=D5UKJ7_CELFN|nr:DUF3137 domain-containing protein [Cellulomonas flavigena]ADG75858.1 hypothetical protein Cfla_2975 [Cellulomonas flavigena DSM 20109]
MSVAPPARPERPWVAAQAQDAAAAPRRRGLRISRPVFFAVAAVQVLVFVLVFRPRMGVDLSAVGTVLVLVGLMFVVVKVANHVQDRRHQRLADWGRLNGWHYERYDSSLLRLQSGTPFDAGDAHSASEVLDRPWQGRHAVSFTYTWVVGSGKNRQTKHAHVVALHLPARLPRLEVTPEGLGAAVIKLVGGKDLQLELEEFNREYRVSSADERTAHAVLHPRLMERLLREDSRGLPWRLEGRWLLTWDRGRTDVDRIAARLMLLGAIADAVPRHVWQDHGHDPAAGTIGA